MKVGKQLKLIFVAGIALSLLSSVSVLAIAREDGTLTEAIGNAPQVMLTQTVTEVKKTLQERLTERKETLKTTLTTTQTNRLKTRCVAAQTKLKAVNTRSDTAITARLNAYQAIQDNLQNLVTKVGDAADTTALQSSLAMLAEKVTAFEAAGTTYKQTVADLVEVDCAAEPAGFKASLETAKTEQNAVKDAAVAVRSYLEDTIKPQLQTLRGQLTEAN